MGRWLRRLDEIRQQERQQQQPRQPATDAPAVDAVDAAQVAWREAALRRTIPTRGPIFPPVVRPGDARLNRAGHCTICGDELLDAARRTSPWRRCALCVRALAQVLCVPPIGGVGSDAAPSDRQPTEPAA